MLIYFLPSMDDNIFEKDSLSQELAEYSRSKATQLLTFLEQNSKFLSNETLEEYQRKLNFFIQDADNVSCSSPELLQHRKTQIDIAAQQIQIGIETLKKIEINKSKS